MTRCGIWPRNACAIGHGTMMAHTTTSLGKSMSDYFFPIGYQFFLHGWEYYTNSHMEMMRHMLEVEDNQ
jgi:hypothetical protein